MTFFSSKNHIFGVVAGGQKAFTSWSFSFKEDILKMSVKSWKGFHILVKLQTESLQLKNELICRNFVWFYLGFAKHGNIFTATVDFQ